MNHDVKLEIGEDRITAYLSGEIDHHSAKEMRRQIDEAAERVHPKELVLDFKGVTFMDSSGIGLVMGRFRLMNSFEGSLKLTNVSAHTKKVMRLAGLDKLAAIE